MKQVSVLVFLAMSWPGTALACTSYWSQSQSMSQDWPAADRELWYGTSQGSRLVPVAWYNALFLAGTSTRFGDRSNQERYASRFCDDTGYPLGFVIDQAPGKPDALGLTCAACHTGHLSDGTHSFVVEGGSTDLDLQSYTTDLFASLVAVFDDGDGQDGPVWKAFANEVLGPDHTRLKADILHEDLANWLDFREPIQNSINAGGHWGPGRTDAVQVILNTASVVSGTRAGSSLPASSAPVSAPHVWNAPFMQRVQWNGSSSKVKDFGLLASLELGALVRNAAEVLGVFAEMEITADYVNNTASYPGITSSIKMANLVRLERTLETLRSPAWPSEWGEVDRQSTDYQRGAAIYQQECAACHSLVDRTDTSVAIGNAAYGAPATGPVTRMLPAFAHQGSTEPALGTDPMMACNAQTHTTWAGKFQALHDSFGALRRVMRVRRDENATLGDALNAVKLEKFPEGIATLRLIEELSLRMIYDKKSELAALQVQDAQDSALGLFDAVRSGLFGADPGRKVEPASVPDVPVAGTHGLSTLEEVETLCRDFLEAQAAAGLGTFRAEYKARPLNGIFASPPYLHNGSVPTLDDLLKPDSARPDQFLMGAVLYDTARVGLSNQAGQGPVAQYKVRDAAGRIIPGNSNLGHNFPATPLSDTDRAALLAYLKTL